MKAYVILDSKERVVKIELADSADKALQQAKILFGNSVTAIIKEEWERTAKEHTWLRKAKVEE